MSFNYDTLIDQALSRVGGKRWVPDVGYGFDIQDGVDQWRPPPGPGPNVKNPVLLLKPHGSLNWHVDKDVHAVTLVPAYHRSSTGAIVPPTWDKSDVGQWPWSEVWRSARRVLGTAKMLIVVGYSVPVTDQLSQALLRADVTKLAALVVVNPDSAARRRVSGVMASGLGLNAVVIELSTLEELASYLPVGPHEPKSEMESIGDALRKVTAMAELAFNNAGDMKSEAREIRELAEELEYRLDAIEIPDVEELEGELIRIRDEVRDLDARIDSMLT